jgi:hypothetical protein
MQENYFSIMALAKKLHSHIYPMSTHVVKVMSLMDTKTTPFVLNLNKGAFMIGPVAIALHFHIVFKVLVDWTN